jgi:hypothetical protein
MNIDLAAYSGLAWEVEVSDEFKGWYESAIRKADAIYRKHLKEIREQ